MPQRFDFLVLGGGVAGLSFALEAAQHGSVAVLTKRSRSESNTMLRPGRHRRGAFRPGHASSSTSQDTLDAGAGLNNRDAVEVTVREGPERIHELVALGADFDRRPTGEFDLDPRGRAHPPAHRARRRHHRRGRSSARCSRPATTARTSRSSPTRRRSTSSSTAAARTGRAAVPRRLRAAAHRGDRDVPRQGDGAGHRRRGQGLPLHDQPRRRDRRRRGDGVPGGRARSPTWSSTSSTPPASSTPRRRTSSSARRCAARAASSGCATAPTFMERYHPMGELAPRDIVARAIDSELKRTGDDYVLLDMTHLGRAFLVERFPNIYATCKAVRHRHGGAADSRGACGPLPVRRRRRPTSPGAPACPASTRSARWRCTGLHGANRLASNSLLEGLVFGHRAAAGGASTR